MTKLEFDFTKEIQNEDIGKLIRAGINLCFFNKIANQLKHLQWVNDLETSWYSYHLTKAAILIKQYNIPVEKVNEYCIDKYTWKKLDLSFETIITELILNNIYPTVLSWYTNLEVKVCPKVIAKIETSGFDRELFLPFLTNKEYYQLYFADTSCLFFHSLVSTIEQKIDIDTCMTIHKFIGIFYIGSMIEQGITGDDIIKIANILKQNYAR